MRISDTAIIYAWKTENALGFKLDTKMRHSFLNVRFIFLSTKEM